MRILTRQKTVFLATEGDEFFNRNKEHMDNLDKENKDSILDLFEQIELFPKVVLEVGCSNGFRLDLIRRKFNSSCSGIDPSSMSIEYGTKKYPEISLEVGTADSLPFEDDKFDTIIFGFCLYLCDREDLFKISYEADRCLKNKGNLIIKDFHPPFPYKNRYSHAKDIYTYKMDYSKLFTWNPSYTEFAKVIFANSESEDRNIPDERISVSVLRKNVECAYPEAPFS